MDVHLFPQKFQTENNYLQRLGTSLINTLSNIDPLTLIGRQKIIAKQLMYFYRATQNIESTEFHKNKSMVSNLKKQVTNCFIDACAPVPPSRIICLIYLKRKFGCQYTNQLTLSIKPTKLGQNQQKLTKIALIPPLAVEQLSNVAQQQQINHFLKYINNYKHHELLPQQGCLECQQVFQQNKQLPDTGQTYLLLKYDSKFYKNQKKIFHTQLVEDLQKAGCALLNSGGGYLFIHSGETSILQGINFNEEQRDFLYSCLIQSFQKLHPKQCKLFYQRNFIGTNGGQIIKVKYQPQSASKIAFVKKVFFNGNKITYSLYLLSRENNQRSIFQLKGECFYDFAQQIRNFQIFQQKKLSLSPCFNSKCIPNFQKRQELINKWKNFSVEDKADEEGPQFIYKNSMVIVVSSTKYEYLIKDVEKVMMQKKFQFKLSKPFIKHRKNSLKQIWFLSHQEKYQIISSAIKKIDEQKKLTTIIITKYLKINGPNFDQKFNHLDQTMAKVFKVVGQRKVIAEEQQYGPPHIMTFYLFKQLRYSLFAYIFLDDLQIRLQFAKESVVTQVQKK